MQEGIYVLGNDLGVKTGGGEGSGGSAPQPDKVGGDIFSPTPTPQVFEMELNSSFEVYANVYR